MNDPSAGHEPTTGEIEPSAVEIRVHGIGDHAQWSSLGSARVLRRDAGDGISRRCAPRGTGPSSRAIQLVTCHAPGPSVALVPGLSIHARQTADQMTPGEGWRPRATHKALVHVASLGSTALTTIWGSISCRVISSFNRYEIVA